MKIVVTGSIAYDYLMSFPGKFTENLLAEQLHTISVSFLVDSLVRQRGGTAPNIAYTMALLGGRPTVMATAGQDFADYRAWLTAQGVDTSAIVEIADDFTASFFVTTDQAQNQIASFYVGAMAHARNLTFAEYASDADLTIISPNDTEAMCAYPQECKRLGIPYIYDPSQQTARLTGDDLRAGLDGCYLLSVNEYEYSLIQEKTGLNEAQLHDMAGGILVTKAAKPAYLCLNGKEYEIPVVPPSKLVEPTGAGDAFRAGFMRGLQLGVPLDVAGRMGALAATYVLEQVGTQSHHYTPAAFVERYRQHFDDDGALDSLLVD
ncbi:MAG: carbohydrate kinase family protein [Chloroflexota bacterium]|nr:carbohydrate kinase family protein [Ardenticatenaceae bacterium]